MSVWDKVKNKWYLLEGSVYELRAGIKDTNKECEVAQFNIVLDFLGGYNLTLEENHSTLTEDKRGTLYLLKKDQKWILSQNNEIVKFFYKRTNTKL